MFGIIWVDNGTNYKHSELTSKVIGWAMRVHSTIGNGFQEVIYQS